MNGIKFFILAKYQSKYGLILYAVKAASDEPEIDLENVYLNTLYFKGREDIDINKVYEFTTLKGENGYTYAFFA